MCVSVCFRWCVESGCSSGIVSVQGAEVCQVRWLLQWFRCRRGDGCIVSIRSAACSPSYGCFSRGACALAVLQAVRCWVLFFSLIGSFLCSICSRFVRFSFRFFSTGSAAVPMESAGDEVLGSGFAGNVTAEAAADISAADTPSAAVGVQVKCVQLPPVRSQQALLQAAAAPVVVQQQVFCSASSSFAFCFARARHRVSVVAV